MSAISHHATLIYTMVIVSATDNQMTDTGMRAIGETINFLPVFADYENTPLTNTVASCADLLDEDDGFKRAFQLLKDASLPAKLRETATRSLATSSPSTARRTKESLGCWR